MFKAASVDDTITTITAIEGSNLPRNQHQSSIPFEWSDTVPAALYAQDATNDVHSPTVRTTSPGDAHAAFWSAQHAEWLRETTQQATRRSGASTCSESSELGQPSHSRVCVRPPAGHMGSGVLNNTVGVWRESGVPVNESNASSINESVDIGAQANPSGIYPVLHFMNGSRPSQLPGSFGAVPLSSTEQHWQEHTSMDAVKPMSLQPQGPGAQHLPPRLVFSRPLSDPATALAAIGPIGLMEESKASLEEIQRVGNALANAGEDTAGNAASNARNRGHSLRSSNTTGTSSSCTISGSVATPNPWKPKAARRGISLSSGVATAGLRAAARAAAAASVLAAAGPQMAARAVANANAAAAAAAAGATREAIPPVDTLNKAREIKGEKRKRGLNSKTIAPSVVATARGFKTTSPRNNPSHSNSSPCLIPSMWNARIPRPTAAPWPDRCTFRPGREESFFHTSSHLQESSTIVPSLHAVAGRDDDTARKESASIAALVGTGGVEVILSQPQEPKARPFVLSPSFSEDPDSWLMGLAWPEPKVDRTKLPTPPLDALRSDETDPRDDETGVLFLPNSASSSLNGLEDNSGIDRPAAEGVRLEDEVKHRSPKDGEGGQNMEMRSERKKLGEESRKAEQHNPDHPIFPYSESEAKDECFSLQPRTHPKPSYGFRGQYQAGESARKPVYISTCRSYMKGKTEIMETNNRPRVASPTPIDNPCRDTPVRGASHSATSSCTTSQARYRLQTATPPRLAAAEGREIAKALGRPLWSQAQAEARGINPFAESVTVTGFDVLRPVQRASQQPQHPLEALSSIPHPTRHLPSLQPPRFPLLPATSLPSWAHHPPPLPGLDLGVSTPPHTNTPRENFTQQTTARSITTPLTTTSGSAREGENSSKTVDGVAATATTTSPAQSYRQLFATAAMQVQDQARGHGSVPCRPSDGQPPQRPSPGKFPSSSISDSQARSCWACAVDGCRAPADYDEPIAGPGVRTGESAGSDSNRVGTVVEVCGSRRRRLWCAGHRKEGSKLSRKIFCSFPGCRFRWSWGYEPTVDTRKHPLRCCAQHKHDG